ncbi:hypothetical protein [Labedaea rhizosphaerae]|nr:hypothetical protein [Labedaea rhizosphaerae]
MTAPQPGLPMGRLAIDCSHPGSAANYRKTTLDVTIDGRPVRTKWGVTWFDLPAGPHEVKVKSRYLGRTGAVQVVIPVIAGQQVTAYYRAPAIAFMPGSIGPVPQRTRGVTAAIVLVTVLVCAFVVLGLLGKF